MRGSPWVGLVAAAAVIGTGSVAFAETYTDEQLGFSLQVPTGWKQIPIASEERYIVAKWLSEREYADKVEGWALRFEIKVVLFDPKGKKTAEIADTGEGEKTLEIKNPYRNYKDWVKSDAQGGRYISKEEEIVVNGIPSTLYEVAYEKLTVPRHGLAIVYHTPDIDYCVTTEVLEQHWKNLSPSLLRMMKSFKVFPRKGSVKRETTGANPEIIIKDDDTKLPPEERFKKKLEKFERAVVIATERLPKDWTVKRSKNFVAFSHTDDKFTASILEQAEAVRAWADANLAFFGDGIPGPQILRVCKDYDEERSFSDLSSRSNMFGWSTEICVSRQEKLGWGLGILSGAVFGRWLDDKSPDLRGSMPPWLSSGIREWVSSGVVKNGKLEFKSDADLAVALKLAAKQGTLIPPRDMLLMTYDELYEREKASRPDDGKMGWGMRTSAYQQAAGFIRYLLAGPGKSNAKTKELLKTYVGHLTAIVQEREKKSDDGEATKAPETEEEEEERFKKRESFWKEHQKDLLKAAFEKTFADWAPSDWAALDKAYRNFAN